MNIRKLSIMKYLVIINALSGSHKDYIKRTILIKIKTFRKLLNFLKKKLKTNHDGSKTFSQKSRNQT